MRVVWGVGEGVEEDSVRVVWDVGEGVVGCGEGVEEDCWLLQCVLTLSLVESSQCACGCVPEGEEEYSILDAVL